MSGTLPGRVRLAALPTPIEPLPRLGEALGFDLLLDPVYTATAFLALQDTARRMPGLLGRRVLFLHTGGGFGVFPYRLPLARLLDADAPPARVDR